MILHSKSLISMIITVLLFAATSLYTMETMLIYIAITIVALLMLLFLISKNLLVVKKLIHTRFFWWISSVFVLTSIDAIFRLREGVFNYDFIFFSWVTIILIWLLLYIYGNSEDMLVMFCGACEKASVMVCVYILIMEYENLLKGNIRIGESLSGNVNTVGMHLCIYSFFILYKYLQTKKKRHLLIFILALGFALLTGSKKVLLSFAVMVFMYLKYNKFNINKVLIIFMAGIVMLCMIFTVPVLYDIIGRRTLDFLGNIGLYTGEYNYSNSTNVRLDLIKTAWQCFLDNPVFGGGYRIVAKITGWYSHCNYFEILANYGLVGFIIFYGFYFKTILNVKGLGKSEYGVKCLLLSLIINVLIADIAAVTYLSGVMSYICILFVSVYLFKYREKSKNEDKKIY